MNKTPKLRFKEFSGDWESRKVASVFERVSNKVDVIENEYYKQIGIRSHGKGIFYKDAVSGKELGNKRVFWVEPDVFVVNIVFAWEQAIAKTTQNEVGMIASHRFPMYKPKKKILDLGYITQLFKTPKGKFLLGLASPGGAGRNKTLGQKEFDDLDIILPSYEEQKKISYFISLIDKKIIKQGEKANALKDYKKGIMQKIFSRELRFKDIDGRDYPDWECTKLGECVDIFLGLTYTPTYTDTGIPFLSVKDISNGRIKFNKIKYISNEEYINATNNSKPKKGDILFGRVGTLGSPIVIKDNLDICIFVSLGYLRVKKSGINNTFIAHWMNSDKFSKQVDKKVCGSSQKNLNTGWLREFTISTPTIQEQVKISKFLDKLDEKIEKEQNKLDSLSEYKKGLLQQMFV